MAEVNYRLTFNPSLYIYYTISLYICQAFLHKARALTTIPEVAADRRLEPPQYNYPRARYTRPCVSAIEPSRRPELR